MGKTHYDILKVSRDAPIEVIRAAYRVLSLMHHPDRHPEDPAAATAMGLLNQAYEVLSDPERRSVYDAQLREPEVRAPYMATSRSTVARSVRAEAEREIRRENASIDRQGLSWRQYGVLLFGIAALVLVGFTVVILPAREPQLAASVAAPPTAEDREAYVRRMAREVMLPRVGELPPPGDPAALDGAASPSDDLPASATGRGIPVEPAEAPSEDDAPGQDVAARPAPARSEEPRSAPAVPSASVATETELPPAEPSASEEPAERIPGLEAVIPEDGQPLR